MSEVNYKFQIGDEVRFTFNGWNIVCPIVKRKPSGGGADHKEPLYIIRYEKGFLSGGRRYTEGLSNLSMDGKELPVHEMFLELVQPYIPDIDDDISVLDLI